MSSGKTYKNAPISEVVLGITFTQPILSLVQILNIYSDSLRDEYQSAEIAPILATEILQNGHIVSEPLTEGYGQAVYRFRSTEPEPNWLIQLQRNKIYLHWFRDDNKPVGHYPGYGVIAGKFWDFIERTENILGKSILGIEDISQCELLYQDRFNAPNYQDVASKAGEIFTTPLPTFLNGDQERIRSSISQYVSEYSSINGYGISTFGVEPPIDEHTSEVLFVNHTLRGKIIHQSVQFNSVKAWFDEAHTIQRRLFDNSFLPYIFEEWKS